MRIPIPLILAAIVLAGVTVTILINVNITVLGSYDPSWETYNGTDVIRYGPPPISSPYLYGGHGKAYFGTAVTVSYFAQIGSYSNPSGGDLGYILPVLVRVTSGSLPTSTVIKYLNPWNNAQQGLYFFGTSNGSLCLIIGTFTDALGNKHGVGIVCKVYTDGKGDYWLRPVNKYTDAVGYESTMCNAISQINNYEDYIASIMDAYDYDCSGASWSSNTPSIIWNTLASSVTYAQLSISGEGWYSTTLSTSNYALTIYLAPMFRVSTDPGSLTIVPS